MKCFEMCRRLHGAHDISFLGTDVDVNGGKILLVGGAPRSAGDDTDRLLTAVRETVDRAGRLPLQAGISHGRVFTGDTGSPSRRTYSVKGDAVNLAARLAAHAEPGSILDGNRCARAHTAVVRGQ
jgi:class 3 adenylate cyclase